MASKVSVDVTPISRQSLCPVHRFKKAGAGDDDRTKCQKMHSKSQSRIFALGVRDVRRSFRGGHQGHDAQGFSKIKTAATEHLPCLAWSGRSPSSSSSLSGRCCPVHFGAPICWLRIFLCVINVSGFRFAKSRSTDGRHQSHTHTHKLDSTLF